MYDVGVVERHHSGVQADIYGFVGIHCADHFVSVRKHILFIVVFGVFSPEHFMAAWQDPHTSIFTVARGEGDPTGSRRYFINI